MGEDANTWEVKGEKAYEAEAVVGKRLKPTEYLIKWIGWEEPTWEPLANLNLAKELMKADNKKFVKRRNRITTNQ